jgi:hypothetical protein
MVEAAPSDVQRQAGMGMAASVGGRGSVEPDGGRTRAGRAAQDQACDRDGDCGGG